MNRLYETIYIAHPELSEEELNKVEENVQAVIIREGGTVEKVDRWGKRKLAYRVKKQREGIYTLIHFMLTAEKVAELERHYQIDENIIKHIIVKVDWPIKEEVKKAPEAEAAADDAAEASEEATVEEQSPAAVEDSVEAETATEEAPVAESVESSPEAAEADSESPVSDEEPEKAEN